MAPASAIAHTAIIAVDAGSSERPKLSDERDVLDLFHTMPMITA